MITQELLSENSGLCGDIGSLLRSPNLSPSDFFFCGCGQVIEVTGIKKNLQRCHSSRFAAIQPEMTRQVKAVTQLI